MEGDIFNINIGDFFHTNSYKFPDPQPLRSLPVPTLSALRRALPRSATTPRSLEVKVAMVIFVLVIIDGCGSALNIVEIKCI